MYGPTLVSTFNFRSKKNMGGFANYAFQEEDSWTSTIQDFNYSGLYFSFAGKRLGSMENAYALALKKSLYIIYKRMYKLYGVGLYSYYCNTNSVLINFKKSSYI